MPASDIKVGFVLVTYMFDTVVFNDILDGKVSIEQLPVHVNYAVTHIQWDEICKTPDECRKRSLQQVFQAVDPIRMPTESFVWGVSRWGEGKWPVNDGVFEGILSRLNACKKKKNNIEDALIAETAYKNGLTLVTRDDCLYKVAKELKLPRFGGQYRTRLQGVDWIFGLS